MAANPKNIIHAHLLKYIGEQDIDDFLNIGKIIEHFSKLDKSIAKKAYEILLETGGSINNLNTIDSLNPVQSYNIYIKHEPDGTSPESIIDSFSEYRRCKSSRYYVKKLMELITWWPDSFGDNMNLIYELGLFNSLNTLYNETDSDKAGCLADVGYSNLCDAKTFAKLMNSIHVVDRVYGECELYNTNPKIFKIICRYIMKNDKFGIIVDHVDIKNIIFAKSIGIKTDIGNICCRPEFGFAIRKYKIKSFKFRVTEKIMQIFTTRNMSKLILYYV